jgi:2-polyprenyl-3-methyl-5-hydroxy-6-metoxy-1,4-benzoquinol methylase
MINLSRRSYEKELMDRDDIPFSAMAQTLKELNIVNTRLGGHAITLKGTKMLERSVVREDTNHGDTNHGSDIVLTICEIGCGGGDNLFAIYKSFVRENKPVRFIGIDMNPECIAFARQQYPDLPCEWICSDYALVDFKEDKPGIIFSSLFCHHFTDEQLVFMLQWLRSNSRVGFFINDLHRHWLAYYLIKYITKFFSKSWLVKNDASLSVARSFRKEDWARLFNEAGISGYTIRWQWAFRYLVTCASAPFSTNYAATKSI